MQRIWLSSRSRMAAKTASSPRVAPVYLSVPPLLNNATVAWPTWLDSPVAARAPPHRRILSITRRRRIFFSPLLLPSPPLPPFSLLMPFFCDRDTRHRDHVTCSDSSRARRNRARVEEPTRLKLSFSHPFRRSGSKEWIGTRSSFESILLQVQMGRRLD